MAPVKKTKKHKTNAKAAEQLRNWLTTNDPISKCAPPVSFQTFSKVVENLPDIAFQIQSNDASGKSLDECAQWYYNAFYSDPRVRSEYTIRLKPCPQSIKQKLLQLPNGGTGAGQAPENGVVRQRTEKGHEVTVPKFGRFLFPVTFATFRPYMNEKRMLECTYMRKAGKDRKERARILSNEANREKFLWKLYNTFYIFPSPHMMDKLNFEAAPAELQEQLLKLGAPLDELAAQWQAEKAAKSDSPVESVANQMESTCSNASIVSFADFEKHVKNIYEIVWWLKLNDPDYAVKGFEECAYAYYLDFYQNPTIRDRYPYELVDCTPEMKERILAIPQQSEADALHHKQHDATLWPSAQDTCSSSSEIAEVPPQVDCVDQLPALENPQKAQAHAVTSPGSPPVSFETFKRYVLNLDEIVQQMLACKEYTGKSRDECALEYFKAFYSPPQIRERFKYQLKPCPGKMKSKLLALPEEVDVVEETNNNNIDLPNQQEEFSINEISSESDQLVEHIKNTGSFRYPVSFETFMRYLNHDEFNNSVMVVKTEDELLLAAMQKHPLHPQRLKLLKRYYRSFYVESKTCRSLFKYEFVNVQPELLQKLLETAVPLDADAAKKMAETAKNEQQTEEPLSSPPPDLYKFFKHHIINLEQIVSQMLACSEYSGKSEDECALEYFKAFYADPQMREKSKFEIKPCLAEIREKLSIPAADPPEAAPEVLDKNCISGERRCNEALVQSESVRIPLCGIIYEFPVSLQIFERFINYNEVKLQLAQAYADTTADECNMQEIMRRFYQSFYTNEVTRNLCNFNFDAAPAELREKLLQFAKPLQSPPWLDEASNKDVLNQAVSEDDAPESPAGQVQQQERGPIKMNTFAIKYPVSFNIFANILYLDDVVRQMQQVPQHANMTSDECKIAYYHAFYRTPAIRETYKCAIRPCPVVLKDRLLQIPKLEFGEHKYHRRTVTDSGSAPTLEALYMAKKAALDRMKKTNVVNYKLRFWQSNAKPENASTITAPKKVTNTTSRITRSQTSAAAKKSNVKATSEIAENDASTEADTATAQPATTQSADTEPAATEPAATEPAATEPAPTQPAPTQPASGQPASGQPVATQSAATQPALGQTAPGQPAATQPATTQPAATQPSPTQPSTGQPATTQPAATHPAATQPETTQPAASEPAPGPPAATQPAATDEVFGGAVESLAASATSTAAESVLSPFISITVASSGGSTSVVIPRVDSVGSPTASDAEMPQATSISISITAFTYFFNHFNDHNFKYLLCTSHGLRKTVWRILSQLSYLEFKTYTNVYKGESFYMNERILTHCYYHVMFKGNWPVNLYVKLSSLGQLLHSKGVQLDKLDLAQLSPKMLHWHDLNRYSDFGEIVRSDYLTRTGQVIQDLELDDALEQFHALCWTHDRWIQQVPELNQPVACCDDAVAASEVASHSSLPFCLIDETAVLPEDVATAAAAADPDLSADAGNLNETNCQTVEMSLCSPSFVDIDQVDAASVSPEDVATAAAAADPDLSADAGNLSETNCQTVKMSLCSPSFVDIDQVDAASQATQNFCDPLMEGSQAATIEAVGAPVPIKDEPAKFLNMLRFSIDTSQSEGYKCEVITTQEQIINLDDDEEERVVELACFAIEEPTVVPPVQLLAVSQSLAPNLDDEVRESVSLTPQDVQVPAVPAEATVTEAPPTEPTAIVPATVAPTAEPPPARIVTRKKQSPTTTTRPSKRPRLMADNVPQLKHAFRPLPLAAVSRKETLRPSASNSNKEKSPQKEMSQGKQSQDQSVLPKPMTASQAFAADNTLMASSQLERLLDAAIAELPQELH